MRTGEALVSRLALALLIAATFMSRAGHSTDAPTTGVWQKHEYELQYAGFNSAYSCDWLEEKLRLLLKTAGARVDVQIKTHCIEPSGPSPGAAARIVFFTLAAGGGATDTPAAWRKVSLRDHSPMALEALDCELVAQFRDQLLPLFTTRAMVDRTRCRPGESSSQDIQLAFEVLAPTTAAGR